MVETKRLTGSGLKWIAMVSMLIDHIGAVLIIALLRLTDPTTALGQWCVQNRGILYGLYIPLRRVGRFAFPIYCFLLVEGFSHTRSVNNYALRLALFAIVSEIPFDLAFNTLPDWSSNNVFFTLLTGLLCIWGTDTISKRFPVLKIPGSILFAGIGYCLAEFLFQCDYGGIGVIAIVVMYLLKSQPIVAFAAGVGVLCLIGEIELWALCMLLPVYFYNGQRGRPMKLAPYIFYPAHLLILWVIVKWLIR